MLIEPAEINALIRLVEDPDDAIYVHVKEKLMDYGKYAIPYIENVWQHPETSKHYQTRLEEILTHIQFNLTKNELIQWLQSDERDLLEGFIILSRHRYPDLSYDFINKYLEKIKQSIWLELTPNLTAFEQIKVFNKVFFEIYGFRGNANDYHSPRNNFINSVLESKKGNPLSLSIIYMIIAQRLEMPIHGVNLPNHFVLGYLDTPLSRLTGNTKSDIVFYINPYSKGALLMHDDIQRFLKELDLPSKDEYLLACDSRSILIRLINNMINAYTKKEEKEKCGELYELRKILTLNKG